MVGRVLLRIEKHSGADATYIVVALQDIIVDTSFTSCPEFLVVGEFGERYGDISEACVEFHYR